MAAFSWTCKTCGRHATLSSADYDQQSVVIQSQTSFKSGQAIHLTAMLMKCPNGKCGALEFLVRASHHATRGESYDRTVGARIGPVGIGSFQFEPTTAQPLSSDVPEGVQEDYREACLIGSLSPKAAATLARRALQGMIRDFWGISKGTLAAELKAIESQCDPELYAAMMARKSVGNIGAHPEKDVNTIIDIEPDEARQLIDLIHLLDGDWYRARAARKARIHAVTSLAAQKASKGDA